jgi:hypothetical protein
VLPEVIAQIFARHSYAVVDNPDARGFDRNIDPRLEVVTCMFSDQDGVERVLDVLAQKREWRRVDLGC